MILELIKYFLIKAPSHLKDLGLVHEWIAIEERYKRNRKYWLPHLNESNSFLLKEMSHIPNNGSVIIFGAGPLLDIPLDNFAKYFSKIYLVDIIWPIWIKHRYRKYTNLSFIEADLTGILRPLFENKSIPQNPIRPVFPKCDWAISANLLTQLPLPVVDFLKRFQNLGDNQVTEISRTIQQAHLRLLKTVATKYVLITDQTHNFYDNQGKLIDQQELLFIKLPEAKHFWDWNLIPRGEIDRNFYGMAKVYAFTQEELQTT